MQNRLLVVLKLKWLLGHWAKNLFELLYPALLMYQQGFEQKLFRQKKEKIILNEKGISLLVVAAKVLKCPSILVSIFRNN